MIDPQNVAFLRAVAEHTDPLFRQLMGGIADWYQSCGTLSARQLASVQVSATKQGRKMPASLLTVCQPEPAPEPSELNTVLAELFGDIAGALTKAAKRLT